MGVAHVFVMHYNKFKCVTSLHKVIRRVFLITQISVNNVVLDSVVFDNFRFCL